MDKESQDIYQVSVLDDIRNTGELSHPVHASFIERILVRNAPLKRLHPNPDDEFSNPKIGPNYEIVGNYRKEYLRFRLYNVKGNIEPLMIEKVSTGGYRILNGHHRWMAAKMINMKSLPVRLVNTIPDSRIIADVERSEHEMCISFDLDEVLICNDTDFSSDKAPGFPFNIIYKERVRKNVGACITELRKLGFDVWVYTGSYLSRGHIEGLLRHHNASIDGIINGMKQKKADNKVTKAFRDKYRILVHVDNQGVLWVNQKTKEYEDIPVSSGPDWASQVHIKIKEKLESEAAE